MFDMKDFPNKNFFINKGDTIQNHLNDSIGTTFKIGMFSYKIINIQKQLVTIKNLKTGTNKVYTKP